MPSGVFEPGLLKPMAYLMNHLRKTLVLGLLCGLAACGGGGGPGASESGSASRPAARARATRDYQLSWQPINSPQATGYRLYYASTPFQTAVAGQLLASATSPDYVVKMAALDVAQGSTLFFAVSATYGTEESALSEPVSIVVN